MANNSGMTNNNNGGHAEQIELLSGLMISDFRPDLGIIGRMSLGYHEPATYTTVLIRGLLDHDGEKWMNVLNCKQIV